MTKLRPGMNWPTCWPSFPDVETMEARTGGSALEIIRDSSPDVVFLDIQMPGRDGFDVLREARQYPEPAAFRLCHRL